MRACHISGDTPLRGGSPFFLVGQSETLFEREYRCGPDFLGQPIGDNDFIVSAKHYFGEDFKKILHGERPDPLFQEICRMAKNGDLEGLIRRYESGHTLDDCMDSPLRLAALNGQTAVVDYLLSIPAERPIHERANDAFLWACKGGSVAVVMAIEAKLPVKHAISEDGLLMIARQGDQRLFRHLILSSDVKADTEYLLEMVRNKWAEDAICERIFETSKQSGGLSGRRGVRASL